MHQFDNLPPAPLTIEGSSVLHQMLRLRWPAWRALAVNERTAILNEATAALSAMERDGSAAFSLLGHKGDLMLIHFRADFEALLAAQTRVSHLRLWDYLEQTTSYVSVVELGLYESTMKTYTTLAERGVEPHSTEWNAEIGQALERSREAMKPRLYPEVPPAKFVCFYPMDRRRGEQKNWYQLPMAERQRQMHDHGMIGRRYAGTVKQIITGSIGFDDWEWGVDLFADDPLVFKRLIYEMRFDEVSAVYAQFGHFYVGQRAHGDAVKQLLSV
jgi:chlorite dismutase